LLSIIETGRLWPSSIRSAVLEVHIINYLYIGIGGFLGAITRYAVGGCIMSSGRFIFPMGTFIINATGSLLLGLLFGVSVKHLALDSSWRIFFGIGFLGAYTTFSTFSLETMRLIENGSFALALLNIFGSVLVSLLAVYIGLLLGRSL
jgi:CrcB protein